MTPENHIPIAPVEKSLFVRCTPERAFEVFTREVRSWWPTAKHSVGQEKCVRVAFEERVGGRFYEEIEGGEEALWGRVTLWDPPHRLTYTWHPGRGEGTAQLVAIRFAPEGDGTRVTLVHSGWEKLGEGAAEERAGYEPGWDFVLGFFVEKAEA